MAIITTDTFRLTIEGRPNGCFENSMTAVWHMPERLNYCEGFEIFEGDGWVLFNHHAQVLDRVTGKLHEVTPGHDRKCKYIYRSFWWHELYDPCEDDSIEDPFDWVPQLTLKAQHDLLVEHGYSVELWAGRYGDAHPAIPDENEMEPISCWEEIRINKFKGAEDWFYEWRARRARVPQEATALQGMAAA